MDDEIDDFGVRQDLTCKAYHVYSDTYRAYPDKQSHLVYILRYMMITTEQS
jgi:hypothetical protein